MTAVNSAWLIGSFTLASDATITINGNGVTVAAGTYYLRHATTSISLIDVIATALQTEEATTLVFIGKDRKLRITCDNALTLAIPASLQAVTGLAASPSVGTTVSADNISTLLWSPSYPERAAGHPSGMTGFRVYDRKQTASPSGLTTRTTLHHYTTRAHWAWSSVPQNRAWTTDAGVPGEFHRFLLDVLYPGCRFQLYPGASMIEDSAVTTAVSWPTALGPYVADAIDPQWYRRTVAASDTWAEIELEAHVVSELS